MDFLSRIARRPGRIAGLALLLSAALVAACGPRVVTGRPPFVGISSMALGDSDLATQFRISNQNGVPMTLRDVEIAVTVDGVGLVREKRALSLSIDANSAEEVDVSQAAGDAARNLLLSLQNGEVLSLPFTLDGRVRTEEDGNLRFEHKGHLYPVPGRPGQFRSAVTQAQELRREEKL